MKPNRREFVQAVAAAALVPTTVRSRSASPVTRWTMWPSDDTQAQTLSRCNRLLAADPDDVLALCYRGQLYPLLSDRESADADLSRAIRLDPANPVLHYIRGMMLDDADDLRYALALLSGDNDIDGRAICSKHPGNYKWSGPVEGELAYMAWRELGFVLGSQGDHERAIAAYSKVVEAQVISKHGLEAWADASFGVKSFCLAFVEYTKLIGLEPKWKYIRRRDECVAAMRSA